MADLLDALREELHLRRVLHDDLGLVQKIPDLLRRLLLERRRNVLRRDRRRSDRSGQNTSASAKLFLQRVRSNCLACRRSREWEGSKPLQMRVVAPSSTGVEQAPADGHDAEGGQEERLEAARPKLRCRRLHIDRHRVLHGWLSLRLPRVNLSSKITRVRADRIKARCAPSRGNQPVATNIQYRRV